MARHLEMRGWAQGWLESLAERDRLARISIAKRMLEARLPVSVILSCVQIDHDQLKAVERQLEDEQSVLGEPKTSISEGFF